MYSNLGFKLQIGHSIIKFEVQKLYGLTISPKIIFH